MPRAPSWQRHDCHHLTQLQRAPGHLGHHISGRKDLTATCCKDLLQPPAARTCYSRLLQGPATAVRCKDLLQPPAAYRLSPSACIILPPPPHCSPELVALLLLMAGP